MFNTNDRPSTRLAFYLIPPYHIAQTVAGIHRMLYKQFGLVAADRFPIHATIKGFFKPTDGPLAPLVERLDAALATQQPFPAHITLAFRDFRTAIQAHVLDYLQDVPLPNEPFLAQNFHLLEFSSNDWLGSWEQTLTWRLLKSWQV
jgi:2'-5' RNA ligase